jgi:hypothetical protein
MNGKVNGEFIKLKDITSRTGISASTIKRYIEEFSGDSSRATKEHDRKNPQGYWVVNYELFIKYRIQNNLSIDNRRPQSSDHHDDRDVHHGDKPSDHTTGQRSQTDDRTMNEDRNIDPYGLAKLSETLNSQLIKREEKILSQYNRKIIALVTGFVVIIFVVFIFAYLYRSEKITETNERIVSIQSNLNKTHKIEKDFLIEKISSLNKQIKDNKQLYNITFSETKIAYSGALNSEKQRAGELKKELKESKSEIVKLRLEKAQLNKITSDKVDSSRGSSFF